METLIGILIPFIGTTAGAACVYFMKNKMKIIYRLFLFYLAIMFVWTFVAPIPEWLHTVNLGVIFVGSTVLYFIRESKK